MKHIVYFVFLILMLFQSCTPKEQIKGKTWEGRLYRQSDNKELSEVKLKMSNDSLYLFSNAVFGADNDTLVLAQANEQDSVYTYRSIKGDEYTIVLRYSVNNSVENLYITDIERDFYLVLGISPVDIWTSGSLDFYKNRKTPRETYKYLDGVYEGEFESDDFFESLALLESGGMTLKLVFMNDSQLKMCLISVITGFLSGKKEPCDIVNYRIEGDNIIIHKAYGKIMDKGKHIR
ncbi:MAG: hypothetical protein LBP63_01140, partial [Prevotellaceae bacterium]|nr:hypothetical protein [Prevotellaceae bacterium]